MESEKQESEQVMPGSSALSPVVVPLNAAGTLCRGGSKDSHTLFAGMGRMFIGTVAAPVAPTVAVKGQGTKQFSITDNLTIFAAQERVFTGPGTVKTKQSRPGGRRPNGPASELDESAPGAGQPKGLNERQAAEELGVAAATLRTWRCRGKGPKFRKYHGAVRYDREEIERFKLESDRDPASVRAGKETKRGH
jgi:hypothetical protein